MKAILTIIIIGATGCMDLSLIDDVRRFDTASEAQSYSSTWLETGPLDVPVADPSDDRPPEVTPLVCLNSEEQQGMLCISKGPGGAAVRFETDEPARVETGHLQSAVVSPEWATRHGVVIGGLDVEDTQVDLEFFDANDNRATVTSTVSRTEGPGVALTEVLYDPLGPEPRQEFVELVNFGPEAVDLSGWMIDDNLDQNGDLLPSGSVLESGAVALLVAPEYDGAEGSDPGPLAATILLRLESSIATSGLKNSEPEDVVLYDLEGVPVSTFFAPMETPPSGSSVARIHGALPDGALWGFQSESSGPSPGGVEIFD